MENQTREEELAALKAQLQVASDRCEEVIFRNLWHLLL
jgi:hypothetical protein